jgi:carbonic anhydrase
MKMLLKGHRAAVCVMLIVLMNIVLVLAVYAQDSTSTPPPAPHWTYEGAEGPEFWGKLAPEYALCSSGRAQSPIDIKGAASINLNDIQFNYQPSALNIFNNGHTIQVNYDKGSSIVYNENTYQLVQFHFHHRSEHKLDGKDFDMELHFVHQDAKGNLAVVGVMLKAGEKDNEAFKAVFDNLPPTKGDPQPTKLAIDASKLLPEKHLYDTYTGSLTTPPCSQGVRWLVLTTPVEISEHQIEVFGKLFESNARPVQPLNKRDLLADSEADS